MAGTPTTTFLVNSLLLLTLLFNTPRNLESILLWIVSPPLCDSFTLSLFIFLSAADTIFSVFLFLFLRRDHWSVMVQTEFASNMLINFLPFHCKKVCPRFEFHFTDKTYTSFIPPNLGKMGIQW